MCVDSKTTTEKRGKGCATHLPLWFLKSPNHAELKSLLWPEETFLGALLRKFKASSSRTYSQLSLSQTKCSKTILLQKCVNTHTHTYTYTLSSHFGLLTVLGMPPVFTSYLYLSSYHLTFACI